MVNARDLREKASRFVDLAAQAKSLAESDQFVRLASDCERLALDLEQSSERSAPQPDAKSPPRN